ncbi:unnamed protein product [marine sediment metagenome]|uniref:Uncharacterized protein n=1 Tax=marine sediment metagenome TaxID=412755 RepID=X1C790_9ZZZZ
MTYTSLITEKIIPISDLPNSDLRAINLSIMAAEKSEFNCTRQLGCIIRCKSNSPNSRKRKQLIL